MFSGIEQNWREILDTPELKNILNNIKNDNITPKQEQIFEFARLTKLDNIKIVIVGQDPYPKLGIAHGLAFSSINTIPDSLNNIFKCLSKNGLISTPKTGNLTEWAKQGVLLINRALTTIVGESNTHALFWDSYTISLLKKIVKENTIVMLWGNNAKELKKYLNKGIIMEWAHPSPLAQKKQKFIECDHFIKANELLNNSINWNAINPKVDNSDNPKDDKLECSDKLSFVVDENTQVIFTDGSCYPNNSSKESRAGYSSILQGKHKIILYGNIDIDVPATNQRAEGLAIYKSMKYLRKKEWETLLIITDSEFWINMFEKFMPKWYNTGGYECFEEKKNSDITCKMYELYLELTETKKIKFIHIKSHNKSGWGFCDKESLEYWCYTNNEKADQYANKARLELEVGDNKKISME